MGFSALQDLWTVSSSILMLAGRHSQVDLLVQILRLPEETPPPDSAGVCASLHLTLASACCFKSY